jgi:flagellar hook-associated protein 3 FlgL
MVVRVSTNYIFENSRRVLQKSINNLLHTQEVMATQRKVNHLSDDPVAAGRILNLNTMIAQHDQFIRNLNAAGTFAHLYDGSMNTIISVLSRAKELLIGENNSATSTDQTREAARIEIVSLASQLVSVGNLQYSDRFLYAGFRDDTAPFLDMFTTVTPAGGNTGGAAATYTEISDPAVVTGDAYQITFTAPNTYDVVNTTTGAPVITGAAYTSGGLIQFEGISLRLADSPLPPAAGDFFAVTSTPAGIYVGDSGAVRMETDQDVFQQVNFTGDRVFLGQGITGGVNLFSIFQRANAALRTNNRTELDNLLQEFDNAISQVTSQQSLAGSRQNLYDKTVERLQDSKLNMQTFLSELRDVEVTDAITELNKQENAYQAVLSATGKILQPSLLDFLR